MPITSILSYPPVMTEFEVHWGQLNTARGGTPETEFKLAGGYDLAQFSTDKDQIEQTLSTLEQQTNDYEFALADRDSSRESVRDHLINFRQIISAYLSGSRYERALPETPGAQTTSGQMLKATDDILDLWTRINADTELTDLTLPLTLRGGYDLATFTTDVSTLRDHYEAVTTAERELKLDREDRDNQLQAAYDRMKQYRERVPLELAVDDPLAESLPRLNPTDTGSSGPPPPGSDTTPDGGDTTSGGDAPEEPSE